MKKITIIICEDADKLSVAVADKCREYEMDFVCVHDDPLISVRIALAKVMKYGVVMFDISNAEDLVSAILIADAEEITSVIPVLSPGVHALSLGQFEVCDIINLNVPMSVNEKGELHEG